MGKKKFTFIDLFAGVGGFHQALSSLGGKCVFASEIDEECKKTYEKQFNMEVHGDINKCIDEIPKFDVLCAGFPCQTFSKAGNQEGFEDKEKGHLFYKIIDILNRHPECKFIILENVRNLADNEEFWKVIQRRLSKCNFYITKNPIILSPDQFGIPQNRERVYILGINKKICNREIKRRKWISYEDLQLRQYKRICLDGEAFKILNYNKGNIEYKISAEERKIIGAWEEFKRTIIPNEQIGSPIWLDYFGIAENKYNKKLNRNAPEWKKLFVSRNRELYKNNKTKINKWYRKYKKYLTKSVYRKFEWNCGSKYYSFKNCIIQFRQSGLRIKRADAFPSLVAIVNTPIIWDNYLDIYRRISIKEAAKLQSFDSKYKFSSSKQQTYKQLGNSVNVYLINSIAKQLFALSK